MVVGSAVGFAVAVLGGWVMVELSVFFASLLEGVLVIIVGAETWVAPTMSDATDNVMR